MQDAFFVSFRPWATFVGILLCCAVVGIARANECDLPLDAATSYDNVKQVWVKQVVDGDTVRLQDNQLVRFIGINAPEIDHESGNSQPIAEQSRHVLQEIVTKNHGKLQIQWDAEHQDRHGRLLAHVFTPEGGNIQAQLIRQGMGVWIVVPPNLAYMDCYRSAEQLARQERRGVWGAQFQHARDVNSLSDGDRGFQWIRGKIVRVGKGRKYIWLNFAAAAGGAGTASDSTAQSRVALRVHKDDLHYFNDQSLDSFRNRTIEVKGWLSQYKNQLVMRLRHPASLEMMN